MQFVRKYLDAVRRSLATMVLRKRNFARLLKDRYNRHGPWRLATRLIGHGFRAGQTSLAAIGDRLTAAYRSLREGVDAKLLELQCRRRSKRLAEVALVAKARMVGGAISVENIEALREQLSKLRGAILIEAEPLEAEQIRILAEQFKKLRVVTAEQAARETNYVLVASTSPEAADIVTARLGLVAPLNMVRVSAEAQSPYAEALRHLREPPGEVPPTDDLQRVRTQHVVLLNDFGFRNRSGYALRRQVLSFLLNGWDVTAVAWACDGKLQQPSVAGVDIEAQWRGWRSLFRGYFGAYETLLLADIVHVVRQQRADILITGNFDAAPYPAELANRLAIINAPVLRYAFDSATPLSGADGEIAIADQGAFLGIDHALFAPIPKPLARRLLRIRDTRPLVALRAVGPGDADHDHATFEVLYNALRARPDVGVVLFGAPSGRLKSTFSAGEVAQEMMPFIFGAADIFVSVNAGETTFGDTVIEASACGLPVVAACRGGVDRVVVDGETGLLTDGLSAAALLAAVDRLVADPVMRQRLGENARRRVEERFTLTLQAEAWRNVMTRHVVARKKPSAAA